MDRVLIIGTSCSGKSSLAAEIASVTGQHHIEMDELFWLPNWTERTTDDFRAQMKTTLAAHKKWVMDGNYSSVGDLVWPQATTIIWLDYSFLIVIYRAISRTIRRVINKEKICAGNTESFQKSFLSRDSIILWVLKTYHDKKNRYANPLNDKPNKKTKIVILKTPGQAKTFLKQLNKETSNQSCK